MIHLIRPDLNVDFLGKSKPFVVISTVFALLSVILLFKPGLNYGIDFTGGAEIQVKAPAGWDIAKLREELTKGGVEDPRVVQIGEAARNEYLVKVQAEAAELGAVSNRVGDALKKSAGEGQYEIQRADVVGPAAGKELRMSAFLSVLYAMLCIMVYITFRFDMRYAPGVLRALGVDVITTLGVWVLLQREFNLTVLAALLTIAGYSCNDTIVIYDRIRDYLKLHPDWDIERAINKSINLNLGRTFITTGATLLVVLSLYFFGGPVLEDFALPLLIGFTVSVPSTIFVANPMIVWMEKRRIARQASGHGSKIKRKKVVVRGNPKFDGSAAS